MIQRNEFFCRKLNETINQNKLDSEKNCIFFLIWRLYVQEMNIQRGGALIRFIVAAKRHHEILTCSDILKSTLDLLYLAWLYIPTFHPHTNISSSLYVSGILSKQYWTVNWQLKLIGDYYIYFSKQTELWAPATPGLLNPIRKQELKLISEPGELADFQHTLTLE